MVYSNSFTGTRKLESIASRIDDVRMAELVRARNPTETMAYLFSLL